MVKVLSDAKTDRILGVHIVGSVSTLHIKNNVFYFIVHLPLILWDQI